jgi:sarcosine oxidase
VTEPTHRPTLGPGSLPAPRDDVATTADLIVVGAGTMGAWTAYWAQVAGGRRVTLLDAWGAGHPRATSGDETRITRAAHGADALYARWSRRALEHWQSFEREWSLELFAPSGVLWFGGRSDGFEARSAETLAAEGIPYEWLAPEEVAARWPQIDPAGLGGTLYEPEAGALYARRGTQAVVAAFQEAGGTFAIAGVRPGRGDGGRLRDVVDETGRSWSAAQFAFCCGPWLPRIFPQLLRDVIRVTKQDVLFIGAPAGDTCFRLDRIPAWADYDAAFYGIGATAANGVKIAPDRLGPVFDPSRGDRVVDPESVRLTRDYLRRRFPSLAESPVISTRVCQYESTPDGHFLIAPHPGYENVWLAGGGSGHGFKHGPRIGEYLVARVDGVPEGAQDGEEEARFRVGPRVSSPAARTAGDDMASGWELF